MTGAGKCATRDCSFVAARVAWLRCQRKRAGWPSVSRLPYRIPQLNLRMLIAALARAGHRSHHRRLAREMPLRKRITERPPDHQRGDGSHGSPECCVMTTRGRNIEARFTDHHAPEMRTDHPRVQKKNGSPGCTKNERITSMSKRITRMYLTAWRLDFVPRIEYWRRGRCGKEGPPLRSTATSGQFQVTNLSSCSHFTPFCSANSCNRHVTCWPELPPWGGG